ncbi:MAG: hypothetical protein HGGPFJEG_01755 [Ignavibacteria bacterium]|nr:hypothetical protein [Ignavibacteria bacterium]
MNLRQIALAFSNGNFEQTMEYFADDVEWIIVGEKIFKGKNAVIEYCRTISEYFNSVETDFKTINVISSNKCVAVSGTAEFKRNNERVAFVYACDIYEFNNLNKLRRITSYCIQDNIEFV